MASPQTEDGYTKIANEILEALAKNRLSGRERQIIDVIFRKTYGYGQKSAEISLSLFSTMTGIPRPTISVLLKGLLRKTVIGVTQNSNSYINSYYFIKDYALWRVLPKKVTAKFNRVTQNSNRSGLQNGNKTVTVFRTHKRKKERKKEKTKHLDYVLLTEKELLTLKEKYGNTNTQSYIEKLNSYIGSKGKRYKSHYHTIITWLQKDNISSKKWDEF